MPIITRPAVATDAPTIASIYNQGIEERGATFETEPRTTADILGRLEHTSRYPMLVADDDGQVVGWASLSNYRPRECYAGIAEFSIYLERSARGRGTGRVLLEALVEAARARGYWKLVSRIFPFNTASRALCHACGFREVGVYERHARLDGRWLDVVIVERLIEPTVRIELDDLSRPQVVGLVEEHLRDMFELSPPEHVFAFDVSKLTATDVTFWTAWRGDVLLGCAALKEISETDGEIKSMRTPAAHRGTGAGRALVNHIIDVARARGYQVLYLETGTHPAFVPAQTLYASAGFVRCGPFGSYRENGNSVFMSLPLATVHEE